MTGAYVSMHFQEGAAEVSPYGNNGAVVAVDYRMVSNPEFLREGSAVYDSFFPNRIVLGSGKHRQGR
jgi:UDPglucose 6-dehydrogenase